MSLSSRNLGKRRAKFACENCRKRKSKCDGYYPCSKCEISNNTCFYNRPINGFSSFKVHSKKQRMYKKLDQALEILFELRNSALYNTEDMFNSLDHSEEELLKYKGKLDEIPDLERFYKYEGSASIETALFDYDEITFGQHGPTFLSKKQDCIERYHGLYGLFGFESVAGFGWMVQQLGVLDDSRRRTILLFLKYLDFCSHFYFNQMSAIESPVEWITSEFPHMKGASIFDMTEFISEKTIDLIQPFEKLPFLPLKKKL